MFGLVAHVKFTSTWMAEPRGFPAEHYPEHHTPSCCLLTVHPDAITSPGVIVKGPSNSLFVLLGGSVVLPCYADRKLGQFKEKLKIKWKLNNSDLVHLYEDCDSQPKVEEQDYHDRAHFFTDEIQHGNFSLHLDKLRIEDEGEYTYEIFRDSDCLISDSAKLELSKINALIKALNYSDTDRAMIIFFFGLMLFLCVIVIIYIIDRILGNDRKKIHAIFRVVAVLSYEALSTLQFLFLFYAFGAIRGAFFLAGVLPLIVTLRRHNWDVVCGLRIGCTPLVLRSMWFVFTLVMNAVMVYFYVITLENENDEDRGVADPREVWTGTILVVVGRMEVKVDVSICELRRQRKFSHH